MNRSMHHENLSILFLFCLNKYNLLYFFINFLRLISYLTLLYGFSVLFILQSL